MRDQVRAITNITVVGAIINVALSVVKLIVGLLVASSALVADGVHSLSDLLTDVFVVVGARLSGRPADGSHTYGHGRYETVAAFLVGVALIVVGVLIVWEAGMALYRHEHNYPGYAVLIVAVISIGSKEWIYQATQKLARRLKSPALSANAWHHRSDALSSVAVLIGGIGGLMGWGHGDQIAAIAVGAMVGVVGFNSIWKAFLEFAEGSIPEQEQEKIRQVLGTVEGVRGWHRMRTRSVGREIFMDLHLLVDGNLTVHDGHKICDEVERTIRKVLDQPVNILVHLEPE